MSVAHARRSVHDTLRISRITPRSQKHLHVVQTFITLGSSKSTRRRRQSAPTTAALGTDHASMSTAGCRRHAGLGGTNCGSRCHGNNNPVCVCLPLLFSLKSLPPGVFCFIFLLNLFYCHRQSLTRGQNGRRIGRDQRKPLQRRYITVSYMVRRAQVTIT